MSLIAKFDPEQGKPGTKVTITVEQFDVEEPADYVVASVVGQPFTRRLEATDEDGIYSTTITVPYEAYPGTFKVNFRTVGGEEEKESAKFKVV